MANVDDACFPVKLIPCTHTEQGPSPSSSCSICLRVQELNKNVVETKRGQDDALEQLSRFLEEVNHRYDPLQRLPVELATSIFLYLSPPPSLDVFDVTPIVRKQHALRPIPFLLGSVCRYWRRIVWSTPQFWNVIWLYATPCQPMGHIRMLSEYWLKRSSQLPLYVCMFLPDNMHYEHEIPRPSIVWKAVDEIIDTLKSHMPRMRVLHLSLSGPQIEQFWQTSESIPALPSATTNDSVIILEKLFIDVTFRESTWDDDEPIENYEFKLDGIASPSHVSLQNINFWDIGIRQDNLTFVETSPIFLRSALTLLEGVPQMQHFKIKVETDDEFRHPPSTHITHKSLKTLICNDDPGTFLNFMTCPILEKLSYGPGLVDQTFLERSACQLKDLTVRSRTYLRKDMKRLSNLLHLTPLLTRFSFDERNYIFSPDFSSSLARFHPKLRYSLPRLRVFQVTYSFSSFRNVDWSEIPSIIPRAPDGSSNKEIAWEPSSQLRIVFSKTVADIEGHVIDPETLSRIRELVRDGVGVEIEDGEGVDLIRYSQEFHELN